MYTVSMTYEEIVKLGNLVQINVSEEESADLLPKMESVLGYIDQIQNIEIKDTVENQTNENPVLREDISELNPIFGELFIHSAPESESGYVKVPKVLGSKE